MHCQEHDCLTGIKKSLLGPLCSVVAFALLGKLYITTQWSHILIQRLESALPLEHQHH